MSVLSVPRSSWALPRSVRALRLEMKRNAVPYLLPLLAAVFYFDAIRSVDGSPPVWTVRAAVIPDGMLVEFTVFATGLAAWAGSREGRRKTRDLIASTPRAAWVRLSVTLAGTLCWLLLAFLAGVAVLYLQTAMQATWGGPPLWPVFVGVAAVTVTTVIGFTAGVFFPGRFTAPLAAIGVAALNMIGFREALGMTASSSTDALLSPSRGMPMDDSGVFYHVAPDVSIVQVMFMGGIAVALFGVLGLAPSVRELVFPDGRGVLRATLTRVGWLQPAVATILVACGVAAACTAFVLVGTARPDPVAGTSFNGEGYTVQEWEIPALHSAASDQPLPVLQNCTSGSASLVTPGSGPQSVAGSGPGFQTCVNPAFDFDQAGVATALDPVAAEIADLPGAPVRAEQVASLSGGQEVFSGISGNPPVFYYTAQHVGTLYGALHGIVNPTVPDQGWQQALLDAFLEPPSRLAHPPAPLDAAQQAVEDVLLTAVGSQPLGASSGHTAANGKLGQATLGDINAAAQRFGSLSASARDAWLAAHLAALRAGTITLAQLP